MRRVWLHACISFMFLFTAQVNAQTLLNGGFEAPVLGNGNSSGVNAPLLIGTNTNTVGNWDLRASSLLAVSLVSPARVEILDPVINPVGMVGNQLAVLSSAGLAGVGTSGSISQDLGASFTANTRYILNANLGLLNTASALSSFGMQITAGGVPIATRNNGTILSLLVNSNQLYNVSLIFDTGSTPPTGDVGVRFFQDSLAGVAGAYLVDNVSFSTVAAVPEPASVGLILLSGVGISVAWYRHHRKQKQQFDQAV